MSSALTNRLIGTIILVALAVIFLPDFLDGEKESREPLFETVPTVPAKKPIVNPEPFPLERVKDASQRPIEIVSSQANDEDIDVSTQPNEARDVPVEAANTNPGSVPSAEDLANQTIIEKPNTQQSGAGWVVQLGSFRHEKNVRLLLDKLEKAGYRAFSRPIQTQSGPLTKVFVGPDLQKSKLDAALPHLNELTGLNGKVTPFAIQP